MASTHVWAIFFQFGTFIFSTFWTGFGGKIFSKTGGFEVGDVAVRRPLVKRAMQCKDKWTRFVKKAAS